MNIWFVSAAHGRLPVVELTLMQRGLLLEELAERGAEAHSLIVAEDENLDLARGMGHSALEHPNYPLGAAFNAGIEHACLEGATHVVYIGSDDWFHPDAFPAELPPSSIVYGRTLAAVNLVTGKLCRCLTRAVIPWIIPCSLLRPSAFKPISPTRKRGLDASLIREGLERRKVQVQWQECDPHDLSRVDFKTPENITPYESLRDRLAQGPEEDAWSALRTRYPDELVDAACAARWEGVVA